MTADTRRRVGGAVGALVGVVSVIAGARVLLGIDRPAYTVLQPLVAYNVVAGVVSIVAGAALMGAHSAWAARVAGAIACAHLTVWGVLLVRSSLGWPVANDSLGAMTFRAVVWAVIVAILRMGRASPPGA